MTPRRSTSFAICMILALLLPACSNNTPHKGDSAQNLERVTLLLNWYPEAEHGGYYAAFVHGYYREAGLDVKIIPGGPNSPVIQQVARKSMTFGIENADRVLLARAAEADVVAVMAPIQTSPRCLLVHRKSGITNFSELKNVTLALSSSAPWAAFLRKHASLENVQFVPYTGSVTHFLNNENFAQQAYVFSEPFIVEQQGEIPVCLLLADLGYNPYTSLLITHSEAIRSSPETVKKMVAASVRGWRKYLDEPGETNRHINSVNPQMGVDVLDYGVQSLKPLCIDETTPVDRLGSMTGARWKTLADQLVEVESLKANEVDPTQAFTTQFLQGEK